VEPGLAEEKQEHVFGHFYRADLPRAHQSGGLGQRAIFATSTPASAAV